MKSRRERVLRLTDCVPRGTGELPFLSVLQHIRAFQHGLGPLPDPFSRNPHEAVLGQWLLRQATALRRKELMGPVKGAMDDALGSGWFRLS